MTLAESIGFNGSISLLMFKISFKVRIVIWVDIYDEYWCLVRPAVVCNFIIVFLYFFLLCNLMNHKHKWKWSNSRYLVGWLVVFNVPSTARSLRNGTPIYCPLLRTWSSVFTRFPPGIGPRVVVWQSITQPLRHASSLKIFSKEKLITQEGSNSLNVI